MSVFYLGFVGGFTPPLGQGDPCALGEPCTNPCATSTLLPCMTNLCFIPYPLTGEEAPQGVLPEWAICDDEAFL